MRFSILKKAGLSLFSTTLINYMANTQGTGNVISNPIGFSCTHLHRKWYLLREQELMPTFSNNMKLLIVTQAVDTEDPVLGFFVRWIEEFAKHTEQVEVICLEEGTHNLPANVRVHSLGKEKGVLRAIYVLNFYKNIWRLRQGYDVVFVHMNPEYVLLGGLLWRLLGKRIALWYTHKSVNARLRLATLLSDVIFTASKESFRFPTKKLHVMGHGIDTDFFSPDSNIVRDGHLLSVGRLMRSKRHDLAIHAAALTGRDLVVAGEGVERTGLESLAHSLGTKVCFLGGLTQEQLRDEYRKTAFLIHTSETGSLDKVVLEALAMDTAVITTSNVFKEFPVHTVSATPEAIAEALGHSRESFDRAEIIRRDHSLQRLIPAILGAIQAP